MDKLEHLKKAKVVAAAILGEAGNVGCLIDRLGLKDEADNIICAEKIDAYYTKYITKKRTEMTNNEALEQLAACWKLGKLHQRLLDGRLGEAASGEIECIVGLADYAERGIGMCDAVDIAFIDEMHEKYVSTSPEAHEETK